MGAAKSRPSLNAPLSVSQNGSMTGSQGLNNGSGNIDSSSDKRTCSSVPRERGRYGVVHVKISSLPYANRRGTDNENSVVVTPKGAIFFGTSSNPAPVQRALANCGIPMIPPAEIPLSDSRAHKLMVIHTDDWYIVPSQEPFSRHSGTCVIIGDKKGSTGPYKIKLGDCFRLGSVGVVVSEIKTESDSVEQRLDARKLQYLKDEALAFDSEEDMAALASDEEQRWRQSIEMAKPSVDKTENDQFNDKGKGGLFVSTDENELIDECNSRNRPETPSSVATMKSHFSPDKDGLVTETNANFSRNNFSGPTEAVYGSGGITNGERFVCYMCYETHDTPTDPLVAPCDCKGDTRYLHVQCLQKWYHSSVAGPQARVIRTTGSGAPACKICGVAYKTTFKRSDGRRANLLEMECAGPYISLVVVTRHDTNPGLFNTKFRLNFGQLDSGADPLLDTFINSLTIGRSSTCNMVLDYRTVSTVHAKISYEDGSFNIQDRDSSNGTMVYLQSPTVLKFSNTMRVRMGRTTMSFQPKRTWAAALRSVISNNFPSLVSSGDNRSQSAGASSLSRQVDPNRRSASAGGNFIGNNTNAENSTGTARRRISGGVDMLLGNVHQKQLSVDELQQIMADSASISSTASNGLRAMDNEEFIKAPRDIIHRREDPDMTLEAVGSTDLAAVRRSLFDNVERSSISYSPVGQILPEIQENQEEELTPRRRTISGLASNLNHCVSSSRQGSARRFTSSGRIARSISADDMAQTLSGGISPARPDTRKESSIVFSNNDLPSYDDGNDLVVGTSYDLLLESTNSPLLPSSPARSGFVDGAVSVPPSLAFTNHSEASSRVSTRSFNAISNNGNVE